MRVPAAGLLLAAALAVTGLCGPAAGAPEDGDTADARPFPAGMSSTTLEGLRCSIVMPVGWDAAAERSLLVILHGNGGTETGMAGSMMHMAERDFVVVAPKSTDIGWSPADVATVRTIVKDLVRRLNVPVGRRHAAGFSNGGWNLAPLAFDDDLQFTSACWMAAGHRGGKPPKHAKKGMGVLALAGENDGNRDAAERTPQLLRDDVRTAEVRIDPGKGHEWPAGQIDYYSWWLGVQEGRFTPGDTLAFDWVEDPAAAPVAMGERRTGGLCFWWSDEDADSEEARALQNETFQHHLVRHFGDQLVAWKRRREDAAEAFADAKLKETPAVVVYKSNGKVAKVLSGTVSLAKLVAALRSVAPDKSIPKR